MGNAEIGPGLDGDGDVDVNADAVGGGERGMELGLGPIRNGIS
jgi:hypothetical protein